MRAIGLNRFGGPEVLEPVSLPTPEARPGCIRIRVHAAGVNPIDMLFRSGARAENMADLAPPYIPGMDAAGVVDAVGPGVTDFTIGDRVMAVVLPAESTGSYGEWVVVPSQSAARIPPSLTFVEAATVPLNGLLARLGLDVLELATGDTVAITGSPGASGAYAVQLAIADGLNVVADPGQSDESFIKQLGVSMLAPRGPEFVASVRKLVPAGVDGLFDTARLDDAAVDAVRDGGRIATVRGRSGSTDRGVTFVPISLRTYAREQEKLATLSALAGQGALNLRVADVLPIAEARRAHELLEAGGLRGRIVLTHAVD